MSLELDLPTKELHYCKIGSWGESKHQVGLIGYILLSYLFQGLLMWSQRQQNLQLHHNEKHFPLYAKVVVILKYHLQHKDWFLTLQARFQKIYTSRMSCASSHKTNLQSTVPERRSMIKHAMNTSTMSLSGQWNSAHHSSNAKHCIVLPWRGKALCNNSYLKASWHPYELPHSNFQIVTMNWTFLSWNMKVSGLGSRSKARRKEKAFTNGLLFCPKPVLVYRVTAIDISCERKIVMDVF